MLLLPARDASANRVRVLDSGADDYVVKPFDLLELLARMRTLVRRGSSGAGARLDFSEVVLDTAQLCVWRNGDVVALLPSEYSLLEYLALHRGEVVTHNMLYGHLFDENDDTLSNLLDVRVSNLRRKLGQNFIVTLPRLFNRTV